MTRPLPPSAKNLTEAHPRTFEQNHYVYPVLSRRSRGISIGVNLNLDKRCNFNCVYCQVDRSQPGKNRPLRPEQLAEELDRAIELATSGRLFEQPPFQDTPAALRRLNDIALSGNGEPTAHPDFPQAVAVCADARRRHGLDDVKLVLITNASRFDDDAVRGALAVLDENNGEIWAKLDAGTEPYYRDVNRSAVPMTHILENLVDAARARPIIIQTLFARLRDREPSDEELAAYARRLCDIVAAGGRIKAVHLHTVARRPAEPWVAPLAADQINAIAQRVRRETNLTVETFHA